MVNFLVASISFLQLALLVSASPMPHLAPSTCSPSWEQVSVLFHTVNKISSSTHSLFFFPSCPHIQTQDCFTAIPKTGVYTGVRHGAAASDPSYLTYKLIKEGPHQVRQCKAACNAVKGCVFANLYQDLYPKGKIPTDLTPEVQKKYVKGNLTCALFSKCLKDSSFKWVDQCVDALTLTLYWRRL